jgi:hypothetical protein
MRLPIDMNMLPLRAFTTPMVFALLMVALTAFVVKVGSVARRPDDCTKASALHVRSL